MEVVYYWVETTQTAARSSVLVIPRGQESNYRGHYRPLPCSLSLLALHAEIWILNINLKTNILARKKRVYFIELDQTFDFCDCIEPHMFATKANPLTFGRGHNLHSYETMLICFLLPNNRVVTAHPLLATLQRQCFTAKAALLRAALAFYWPPISLPRPQTTGSLGRKNDWASNWNSHQTLKAAPCPEWQYGVNMYNYLWDFCLFRFCSSSMILFQKRSLLLKYFKVPTNFRLVCFERREGFGQKSGDIGFQKSRLQGSPGHLLECLSEGAHWIMYEYVLDGNGQWSLGDMTQCQIL